MNTTQLRRHGIRWLAVAGIAVLASVLPITSAQASPIEHSQFDAADTWVEDDYCGDLEVRFDFHDRGVLLIKQRGPDRIPTFTVTQHGGGTITNLATDKAFTFRWHYLEQEVRVADNGDGTHTVLAQVPGPEFIYGPDGQRLFVSGGMYTVKLIVDQAGTPADPSDDVVIGEEFVSDNGGQPQPPWNHCQSFRELTG